MGLLPYGRIIEFNRVINRCSYELRGLETKKASNQFTKNPKHNIKSGDIFESNLYGKYTILEEYLGYNNIRTFRIFKIKFLLTGTIKYTTIGNILKGSIEDPYLPIVYATASIGDLLKYEWSSFIVNKLSRIWSAMIARCYWPKNNEYSSYGAQGVTVDDRWLCCENYIDDLSQKPNFNFLIHTNDYRVDKDKLQFGLPASQKIYSNETCCIIHKYENMAILTKEHRPEIGFPPNNPYYGVRRSSCIDDYYAACIRLNGKAKDIGTFINAESAARVYNAYDAVFRGGYLQNEGVNMDLQEALNNRTQRTKTIAKRKQLYHLVDPTKDI